MITKETVYVVLEYWLTDADWDNLRDHYSDDELYYVTPEKSGPNMFAFATKELADECIAMRKKSHEDHVKASEEHEWADCESDCVLCRTRMNEKTYSYEIKEVDLIKEECNV